MLNLLTLHDDKAANRARGLANNVASWSAAELCLAYERLKGNPPRRSPPENPYFMANHDGSVPKGRPNRRLEKHLARAIYNNDVPLQRESLPALRVTDYEFPLSEPDTPGVGEVDLLGVQSNTLVTIELKIEASDGSLGDSPMRALLEALKYAAIVDGNAKEIASQFHDRFGFRVDAGTPQIVVAAPHEYWTRWLAYAAREDWVSPLLALTNELSSRLATPFRFFDLGEAAYDCPSGIDVRPFLTEQLAHTPVFRAAVDDA